MKKALFVIIIVISTILMLKLFKLIYNYSALIDSGSAKIDAFNVSNYTFHDTKIKVDNKYINFGNIRPQEERTTKIMVEGDSKNESFVDIKFIYNLNNKIHENTICKGFSPNHSYKVYMSFDKDGLRWSICEAKMFRYDKLMGTLCVREKCESFARP